MDANQAFDAIKEIAQSSRDPADVKAMKAHARAVVDQFKAGKASRVGHAKALCLNLEAARATRGVTIIEAAIFMEALQHLAIDGR